MAKTKNYSNPRMTSARRSVDAAKSAVASSSLGMKASMLGQVSGGSALRSGSGSGRKSAASASDGSSGTS